MDNIVQLSSHRPNLHRGFEKIILRAGLVPWDDLFQTLRSCAETDFARKYPRHEVSRWIGHSIAVSEMHHLMSGSSVIDNASSAPPLLRAGCGCHGHGVFDVAVRMKKRRGLLTEPSQQQARPSRRRCDPGLRHSLTEEHGPVEDSLTVAPRSSLHKSAGFLTLVAGWPSLHQAGCEAQETTVRTSMKNPALPLL